LDIPIRNLLESHFLILTARYMKKQNCMFLLFLY